MTKKRKRNTDNSVGSTTKRYKLSSSTAFGDGRVRRSLLSQYYTKVLTLREYLLSKLPATSKKRRKKILHINAADRPLSINCNGVDPSALVWYLDQTLVGVFEEVGVNNDERWKQWNSFSQLADYSESTIRSGKSNGCTSLCELVDFSIWQLLMQRSKSSVRSQHLLCQGFRKCADSRLIERDENPISAIPGVVSVYPNPYVMSLKTHPWPDILALIGNDGQRIIIDLLLDCGIFIPVQSGHGNYYQLSGQPLSEMSTLHREFLAVEFNKPVPKAQPSRLEIVNTPARITFVRNRMLYARAALNAKGSIRFGLRHIHVLNRRPYKSKESSQQPNISMHMRVRMLGKQSHEDLGEQNHISTVHVMMYIFPREFGLHNVFTSAVDPRETVQRFKDYTMREDEIISIHGPGTASQRVPKRLRGQAMELVEKLRVLHSRCPYTELLKHFCPSSKCQKIPVLATQQSLTNTSTCFDTQTSVRLPEVGSNPMILASSIKLPPLKPSFMDYATPTANVSAFCRSVLEKLIPHEFWGVGDVQLHNRHLFMRAVDQFIMLRRFESVTLHDICQGMKISNITWLAPRNNTCASMSQSDTKKRSGLFHEFMYYMFDSILIPLIRAHFYVTESNVHRYRLFFFRHDVWRSLSEPALAMLKVTTFEEMRADDAQKVLQCRPIGFSQLRLLPKETGVRPISNLKHRTLKKGYKNVLGSSINSVLAPVYNMLTYEMNTNPALLGSSISSVGDLYKKLKQFQSSLGGSGKPLYFVKVDVQSAFDTIPQSAVLNLMTGVPRESEYKISKHVEIKPGDDYRFDADGQMKSKPVRKWTSLATSLGDFLPFDQNLESNLALGKKNTIFVQNVVTNFRSRDDLLSLLIEHVQNNIIKIGKKFYRQKNGIPQGSVLSSLLCNYFYADLELNHLKFLRPEDSLLLRLIDDFLLITTNRAHAKKFLQIMHDGLPEYGVSVNPAKTLVNFEISINDKKVARLVGFHNFPYCGSFIDTKSLDIRKDRERKRELSIADSLTVEFSKSPGKNFHRKVLNTFKIQAYTMYFDTSFNSLTTVFSNIYDNFIETATKMWQYQKCLPVQKQPNTKFVIKTINDLVELAFILIKNKGKNKKNEGYRCAVSRMKIEWLAMTAFRSVLIHKQSKYQGVISWLEGKIEVMKAKKGKDCVRLRTTTTTSEFE